MNQKISNAACAVFNGKIVVAGGIDIKYKRLKSVQSYDVVADKWSPMPNMINCRSNHRLVAVRNKLFVIGSGKHFEILDDTCKMFVGLKSRFYNCTNMINAISIGSVINIFHDDQP